MTVVVHAVPDSVWAYVHVPSGVVRVSVATEPSARILLFPPL